jgi:hypothetical protein
MAKKKVSPFPIYSVTEPDHEKVCGQGCDPAEDPAHFINIDLTDEARKVITDLIENLEEVHAPEIEARHHGDVGGASLCSYCQSINQGRALLAHAKEA